MIEDIRMDARSLVKESQSPLEDEVIIIVGALTMGNLQRGVLRMMPGYC